MEPKKINHKELSRHIEQIYRDNFDFLVGYGYSLTPDLQLVKDCIQDIFVKIYSDNSFILNCSNIKAYLARSLKNKLIDSGKSKYNQLNKPLNSNLFTISDDLINSSEDIDDTELLRLFKLKKNFNSLSERQRELLYLRYIEELSYREIAEIMKIEIQSAKNINLRIISKLRSKMLLIVLWQL